MPGSEFFLQDSDAQLLRGMLQRIEQLEASTAERMQPGLLVPYLSPVRSEFWSDTHLEAVSSYWSHYYLMNEINTEGKIFDRTEEEAFAGTLVADKAEFLPQQGQIGGLVSEGSSSIYFPGSERSRIDLPLLSTKVNSFNIEVIFKAQSLPQKAVIFYNGTFGTNGYGLGIGNGAGASGEKLTVKYNNGLIWDPGITLVAGQWYDVNLSVSAGGVTTITAATINPLTKVITVSSNSATLATYVTPTARACLGSADPTTTGIEFKGWIDEMNIFDGIIPSTEVVNSQFDRYRTALEAAPPPGFVKPDGTAVSRAKFDRLFKIIGTIYGAGDGTNTFNLPDIRNRVPLGKGEESLGSVLVKQYGTGGTTFSLLNTNYLVKV